jgi:hypothetical protein
VGVNIEKLAWKKEVKILCVGFREVSLEEGKNLYMGRKRPGMTQYPRNHGKKE